MRDGFGWRTAARIAWREAQASSGRFLFVVVAAALGVGALTGVRSFSRAFAQMLAREARTFLAADVSVRIFGLPTPEQEAVIKRLFEEGARSTRITETVSMLSAGAATAPVLVSVKAVDPHVYPFYGEVKLDPPGALSAVLQPDTVAVSEDLFVRLDLAPGSRVKLGAAEYRIRARLVMEPDRMSGTLNVGPRILMSREGLERARLIVPGSRASQRILFRLDPQTPVSRVSRELRGAFAEAQVIDYRESHPRITRALERATRYLSLVSLIALLVGALGVAMAMQAHLQQKMDTIAMMKSIGARSSQIMQIYLLQTLMLAIAGSLMGIAIGLLLQKVFPGFLARYFPIAPDFRWDPAPALQGLSIGVLATLLFTLPPLVSIRRVRPALILRRHMEEEGARRWRERVGGMWAACAGAIVAGLLAIVWWLSDSLRTAFWFLGGLCISLAVFSLAGAGLLAALRLAARQWQHRLPALLRHGIANLYRPGNQAAGLLTALGVGVMFTLTVYLIQKSLLVQFAATAAPTAPNVFLINITPRERDGISALLKAQPGIDSAIEVTPLVAARLTHVGRTPIEQLRLQRGASRFRRTRSVSWAAALPAAAQLREGALWAATDTAATRGNQVCASEEAAAALGLRVKERLRWVAGVRSIEAELVCIYNNEELRMWSNVDFLFIPGALDGLPALHYAALRMQPAQVAALQRAVFDKYPTVTVINAAEVLAIIQEVVDQVALVVRFLSLFAILAGGVILASSVAGTRFSRMREVVILKTLGATRRRIAAIFSTEYSLLGLAAGLLGSALATVFSMLALKELFGLEFRFDPLPHLSSIVLTIALANASGWLASRRLLEEKPLEALRTLR